MAQVRFNTERAAVRYYRARGWRYSGGKESSSRGFGGVLTLIKNSRNPDGDHMLEIREKENSGFWYAEKWV